MLADCSTLDNDRFRRAKIPREFDFTPHVLRGASLHNLRVLI
jgi:hypothetical protein